MRYKKQVVAILLFVILVTSTTMLYSVFFAKTTSPTEPEKITTNVKPMNPKVSSISGTAPPSSGDWNISDTTTVSFMTLVINGSIFIENGGTLVIIRSIIYMNLTSDGEHWIEVLNGGNLTLRYSTILAYNSSNNYYIKVDSGAYFYMLESQISDAGYKTYSAETFGVWINTDNVTIKDSAISNNYYGLYFYSSENVEITNTIFYNNAYGIMFSYSRNVTLRNDRIYSSLLQGIYISFSSIVTITECDISNNTDYGGIALATSSYISIEYSKIYNNTVGITFSSWTSDITIAHNTFLNNSKTIDATFILSTSTYIYLNNFTNTGDVRPHMGIHFDNGVVGNYWSDYNGSDSDYDLIGDSPYNVTPLYKDNYPLMYPVELIDYDMAIVQNYVQRENNTVYIYSKIMSETKTIDKVELLYYENNMPLSATMDYNTQTNTYYTEIETDINSKYSYQIQIKSGNEFYVSSKKNISLTDLIPPTISDVLWTPTKPVDGDNVTITCTVTDNEAISQVLLSYFYYGQWINTTMQYNSTIDAYQATIIEANGTVFFKIYAKDDNENWATTKLYSIEYSEKEVELDNPPEILNVHWAPNEPVLGDNLTIYLWTADDRGISKVILSYYVDEWTNITMQYNASIEAYFIVIQNVSVDDILLFKIYVFDTNNQCTISRVYTVPFVRSVSESARNESLAFITGDNSMVFIVALTAVISLIAGLGIGLLKRKTKK